MLIWTEYLLETSHDKTGEDSEEDSGSDEKRSKKKKTSGKEINRERVTNSSSKFVSSNDGKRSRVYSSDSHESDEPDGVETGEESGEDQVKSQRKKARIARGDIIFSAEQQRKSDKRVFDPISYMDGKVRLSDSTRDMLESNYSECK